MQVHRKYQKTTGASNLNKISFGSNKPELHDQTQKLAMSRVPKSKILAAAYAVMTHEVGPKCRTKTNSLTFKISTHKQTMKNTDFIVVSIVCTINQNFTIVFVLF